MLLPQAMQLHGFRMVVLYKRALQQDLGSPGLLFPDLVKAGTPLAVPGCVRVLSTPKTQGEHRRALGPCSEMGKGNSSKPD